VTRSATPEVGACSGPCDSGTGMYIAEGSRQGLIPSKTVVVVPARLVQKWRRDLRRFFGIDATALTSDLASGGCTCRE
jgi:hypothetical protein